MNTTTAFHITCLLLGLCWGLEGKAIDVVHMVEETTDETTSVLDQDEVINQPSALNQDAEIDNIVTLIAELKQPSALTTCGVKPNYLSAATQAKKNFVRVVGGTEASGRWPWQVALVSKTTKEPFCGGTLIGREHVVSAAHCFDERDQNDVEFVLGEHDRSSVDGYEQRFPIDCVHVHRRYVKGVPYVNDIAVIKLKTSPGHDVVINDYVLPACMPEKNEFKAGDECYVTGWGYTNFFDLLARKRPQKLNEAMVPLLSNNECQQAYGSYISKKMVCAGYLEGEQRADTCKGDSGGPLICKRDGKWKLFGVTSWGDNTFCNPSPTDSVPGVYTRVDRYRSWIQSRIERTKCSSP
ncbi:chymotrypsinogen A-like [Asterias rubens]|uniref:chymotrypsinogen A-like n=1 Tax=Asterias rubens TaxID=7604 RepID=UPI001454F26B|nr:chymotrypsinogen A-like [Asterias rubens]